MGGRERTSPTGPRSTDRKICQFEQVCVNTNTGIPSPGWELSTTSGIEFRGGTSYRSLDSRDVVQSWKQWNLAWTKEICLAGPLAGS
jgi:hypothetical protein